MTCLYTIYLFIIIIIIKSYCGICKLNSYPQPKRLFKDNIARGVFLGTAVPLVLATTAIAIEAYARVPQKYVFKSSPKLFEVKELINKDILLVFPGAGGVDENIMKLYESILKADRKVGIKRFAKIYDWKNWVGNLFRAAYDSEYVGSVLGTQVANVVATSFEKKTMDTINIHVIGISVGAFAANSFLKTIANKVSSSLRSRIYTRLTLLDPFTSKGIFGPAYGPRQFGKPNYVDYFEHYLNYDDPVPSTNDPLPLALTYDVTKAKNRKYFTPLSGDSMHSWPVKYLADNWRTQVDKGGKLFQLRHNDNDPYSSRGSIVVID